MAASPRRDAWAAGDTCEQAEDFGGAKFTPELRAEEDRLRAELDQRNKS